MATLELVPLRSKFPYTGHMTVRYSSPVINPEAPMDLIDVEELLDSLETITTPQVAGAVQGVGETAARRGVQAR